MKRLTTSTLSATLVVCIVMVLGSSAQDFGGIYTSGEGGFSISIPDQPTARRPVFTRLAEFMLAGTSFLWEDPDETISIEIFRVMPSRGAKLSPVQKKAVVQAYKRSITGEFAKYGIMMTEKPYEFLANQGIELRSVPPKLVTRILLMNERLVVLAVIRREGSDAEMQLELLDSFRLLSKEQHIAVLIRENTPPPLPQDRPAGSVQPDTATMGLRSGVKQIVEMFQRTPTSEKERSKEVQFDKAGNIVSEIHFVAGYPNQMRTWGWVDGARVSNSRSINYTTDQMMDPSRPKMMVDGTPGLPQLVDSTPGAVSFKAPYGLRYESTLDTEQRVIERRVISGAGVITFIEKMTYSQSAVDIRTTDGTGGFISRMVEVVNKDGRIIEERTLDSLGKPVSSRQFAYEFDENGNWITKRVFIKNQTRRTLVDKPLGTYSRTITYY